MKIDRKLNLVIPIETENHGVAHIHSVSISREIFEQFYLELGKVYSQCFDNKNPEYFILSAPQLAYPALKAIAMKSETWDGNGGVQQGLISAIISLTTIIISGKNGWETFPLNTAIQRGMIDEDEKAEVLSSLVFFTVIYKVAPKELRKSFMEMAASLRRWHLTSSDFMEYKNGLPTLTEVGNTGEIATVSSVIY
jgi:hypothetical protein